MSLREDMVKVTIKLDDDEYSEFLKKVGKRAPRDAILEALGIRHSHIKYNDQKSAEIAWRLMKKARDEAERQYYEMLQVSLASEDGIIDEQRVWLRNKEK